MADDPLGWVDDLVNAPASPSRGVAAQPQPDSAAPLQWVDDLIDPESARRRRQAQEQAVAAANGITQRWHGLLGGTSAEDPLHPIEGQPAPEGWDEGARQYAEHYGEQYADQLRQAAPWLGEDEIVGRQVAFERHATDAARAHQLLQLAQQKPEEILPGTKALWWTGWGDIAGGQQMTMDLATAGAKKKWAAGLAGEPEYRMIAYELAQQAAANKRSLGEQALESAHSLFPAVAGFMLTGGLAAKGAEGAAGLATRALGEAAESGLGSLVVRGAGALGAGAVTSAALAPGRLPGPIAQRMAPQVVPTETGDVRTLPGESAGPAITKEAAHELLSNTLFSAGGIFASPGNRTFLKSMMTAMGTMEGDQDLQYLLGTAPQGGLAVRLYQGDPNALRDFAAQGISLGFLEGGLHVRQALQRRGLKATPERVAGEVLKSIAEEEIQNGPLASAPAPEPPAEEPEGQGLAPEPPNVAAQPISNEIESSPEPVAQQPSAPTEEQPGEPAERGQAATTAAPALLEQRVLDVLKRGTQETAEAWRAVNRGRRDKVSFAQFKAALEDLRQRGAIEGRDLSETEHANLEASGQAPEAGPGTYWTYAAEAARGRMTGEQQSELSKIRAEKEAQGEQPVMKDYALGFGYGKRPLPHLEPSEQPAGVPRNEAQVIKTIENDFGIPIRRGRVPEGQPGFYKTDPDVIRVATNNLGAASHELGHGLADVTDVLQGVSGPAAADLRALHQEMVREILDNPELSDAQRERVAKQLEARGLSEQEGFGEYLRHYLTTDTDLANDAPDFTRHFESWLQDNPDVAQQLAKHRGLIDSLRGLTPGQRFLGQQMLPGENVEPIQGRAERYMDRATDFLHRTAQNLLNDWHDLFRVQKAMKSRGLKVAEGEGPADIAYGSARMAAGLDERARQQGVFDITTGEKLGPSRAEVYKAAGLDSDEKVAKFGAWWAAKNHLEQREFGNAGRFGDQYTDAEAEQAARELEEPGFEKAVKLAVEHRNATLDMDVRAGAKSAEEAERIKRDGRPLTEDEQKALDEGKAKPEDFYAKYSAPLPRVMDETGLRGGGRRSFLSMGDVFRRKSREGSDRPFVNPVYALEAESLLRHQQALDAMNARNFYDAARKVGGLGEFMEEVDPKLYRHTFRVSKQDLVKMGVPEEAVEAADLPAEVSRWRRNLSPDDREFVTRIFVDGKEKLLRLDPDVFRFVNVGPQAKLPQAIDTALRVAAKINRAGAVAFHTTFAPAHLAYLIFDHLTQRAHAGLLDPLTKGLPSAAQGRLADVGLAEPSPVHELLKQSGVLFNRFGGPAETTAAGRVRELENIAGERMTGDRLKALAKSPFALTSFMDEMFRTGEFEGKLRDMVSDAHDRAAAEEEPRQFDAELRQAFPDGYSRDALKRLMASGRQLPAGVLAAAKKIAMESFHDYDRGGRWTRTANQWVPFLQASISANEMPVQAALRDPKVWAFRVAQLGAFLVANTLLNRRQDEYRAMDPDEQNSYVHFYNPFRTDGSYLFRIPIGHGLGASIQSGVQAITSALAERDPQALKDWAWHALSRNVRAPIPAALNPLVEEYANKDFRGKPIVSDQMAKRSPTLQYDPSTTETAKLLGNLLGVSPKRLEYAIDQYTGGAYRPAAALAERLAGGRALTARDIPYAGRLLHGENEPSRDLADFYDQVRESERKLSDTAFLRGQSGRGAEDLAEHRRLQQLGRLESQLRDLETEGATVSSGRGRSRGVVQPPGAERRPLADTDARGELERYRIGLARAALGKAPLDRYPNPLDAAADVPPQVAALVRQYRASLFRARSRGVRALGP